MKNDEVVYAINVEDLQAVAKVAYGTQLSEEQLRIVSKKIGDYFGNWFETVEFAIDDLLDLEKLEEPDWDEFPY